MQYDTPIWDVMISLRCRADATMEFVGIYNW